MFKKKRQMKNAKENADLKRSTSDRPEGQKFRLTVHFNHLQDGRQYMKHTVCELASWFLS